MNDKDSEMSKRADIQLLTRVGKAIFGKRWKSDLGRSLKVNLRTSRRWVAGKSTFQRDYWRMLKDKLDKHADIVAGVQNDLNVKVAEVEKEERAAQRAQQRAAERLAA
jgi:hypothetical protein